MNEIFDKNLFTYPKKQKITSWLEAHRQEIEMRGLVVFFEDECPLLWGDLYGYTTW
jgi:hypothetical protein